MYSMDSFRLLAFGILILLVFLKFSHSVCGTWHVLSFNQFSSMDMVHYDASMLQK